MGGRWSRMGQDGLIPEKGNDTDVEPAATVTCAGTCTKPAGAANRRTRSAVGGVCKEIVALALPPATTPAAGNNDSRTLWFNVVSAAPRLAENLVYAPTNCWR